MNPEIAAFFSDNGKYKIEWVDVSDGWWIAYTDSAWKIIASVNEALIVEYYYNGKWWSEEDMFRIIRMKAFA